MSYKIRNGKLVRGQRDIIDRDEAQRALDSLAAKGLATSRRDANGDILYGPTRALIDKLKVWPVNLPGNEFAAGLDLVVSGQVDEI